jgi:signal transduction histidine kinase
MVISLNGDLQLRAAQLLDAFDEMDEMVSILDTDYRVVYANRPMRDFFSDRPVVGEICRKLFHDRERPLDICECHQTYSSGKGIHQELCESYLGDKHLAVRSLPIRDEGGSVPYILHVAADVTEQREAVDALKHSRSSLAEAQRIASLGNWDWDISSNRLEWSDEIFRIFELDPLQFGADYETFLDCVHPEDRSMVTDAVNRALEDSTPYSIDHRIVTTAGDEKIVHEQGKVFRNSEGAPVRMLGTVQDVTRERKREEALSKHHKKMRILSHQLSMAEESERRRISSELHDRVSQNLAACRIRIGQIRNQIEDPDVRESLNELGRAADQLIAETRSLTRELCSPTLHELGLVAALETLGPQILEPAGISCRIQQNGPSSVVPLPVRVELYKSVRELLINVVKHAKAKRVRIQVKSAERFMTVAVQDDGVGFELDEVRRRSEATSGFGLFSIRERIQSIGGRLSVISSIGRGARVELRVPLIDEEEA